MENFEFLGNAFYHLYNLSYLKLHLTYNSLEYNQGFKYLADAFKELLSKNNLYHLELYSFGNNFEGK